MRDHADNVVIVCSIENLDPMGVHTGDSITVAPGADADRPRVPAAARHRHRASSARSASTPAAATSSSRSTRDDGRVIVIEMNPRVSRSSRAGLQGDRLPDRQDRRQAGDRLHPRRDPQRHHPRDAGVSFEPTLDYVVVKVPRFAFEKFPAADPTLTTHDEVGRRGDGDRPQLHRGAAEGAALARSARARRSTGARTRTRRRAGPRLLRAGRGRRPTAGSSLVQQALRGGAVGRGGPRGHRHRPVVPRPDRADQRGRRRRSRAAPRARRRPAAAGQAARLLRRPDRPSCAACPRPWSAASGTRSGVRPVYKTVDTCAAEFAAAHAVPLLAPTTRRPRSRRASGRP